jgi:hypothetical protein
MAKYDKAEVGAAVEELKHLDGDTSWCEQAPAASCARAPPGPECENAVCLVFWRVGARPRRCGGGKNEPRARGVVAPGGEYYEL